MRCSSCADVASLDYDMLLFDPEERLRQLRAVTGWKRVHNWSLGGRVTRVLRGGMAIPHCSDLRSEKTVMKLRVSGGQLSIWTCWSESMWWGQPGVIPGTKFMGGRDFVKPD
jgi:hypothetical protein